MRHSRFLNISVAIALLITIFLTFYACTKEKGSETIKIGAILPLSGDAAQWGQEPQKALELFASEINLQGGIDGKKIRIIFEDSRASPKEGISAVQKLLKIDKVKAIIGPIASTVTLAVAPVVNESKIVLISPASTSHELTSKGGDFVFRTINSDSYEGEAMAVVVYQKYQKKRLGIIGLHDVGVVGMTNSFARNFEELGGTVVAYEKGKRGSRSFKELILKVAESRPDALYVVGYPKDTGLIINQLRELKLNITTFSAQPAEDPMVINIAGDAINGIIFSSTTLSEKILGLKYKEFKSKFKKKYGKAPGSFAPEAYDAINLIIEGLRNRKEGVELKDFLYQISNYNGVSGQISFDRNGDVAKPIVIKEYKGGKAETLLVVEENKIRKVFK